MLLQILEEDKIDRQHRARGQLRNTIIPDDVERQFGPLIKEAIRARVLADLDESATRRCGNVSWMNPKKGVHPEFLNRLDDVIVFRSIISRITSQFEAEINKVVNRLRQKHQARTRRGCEGDFLVEKG